MKNEVDNKDTRNVLDGTVAPKSEDVNGGGKVTSENSKHLAWLHHRWTQMMKQYV